MSLFGPPKYHCEVVENGIRLTLDEHCSSLTHQHVHICTYSTNPSSKTPTQRGLVRPSPGYSKPALPGQAHAPQAFDTIYKWDRDYYEPGSNCKGDSGSEGVK